MSRNGLLKIICFLGLMIAIVASHNVNSVEAKVKLSRTKKNLYVGDTYRLKLKNATSGVKFSSSDKTVATVGSKGKITAKKAGTATITAKYGKKKYTCTVVVRDADTSSGENLANILEKDTNGNEIDIGTFAEANITMINFWEPWCGPCKAELSDIEKLYEDYKNYGFNVIGVYSYNDTDYANSILKDKGITYPIVHSYSFAYVNDTGYVPCTIFVDAYGNIIDLGAHGSYDTDAKYAGARDYEGWYDLISEYLDK